MLKSNVLLREASIINTASGGYIPVQSRPPLVCPTTVHHTVRIPRHTLCTVQRGRMYSFSVCALMPVKSGKAFLFPALRSVVRSAKKNLDVRMCWGVEDDDCETYIGIRVESVP